MKKIFYVLFLFSINQVFAQSPWDKIFDHYTLNDPKLGSFKIHIIHNTKNANKPVLVYLDGSGNYPLFYRTKKGTYNTSVSIDISKYMKDYTIILISKPSIPFSDSLKYDKSGKGFYPDNSNYDKYYSLEWRAQTASKAIDFAMSKFPVDKKHTIVMGYSEGSQVAPRVAVLNKKVTHVICIVGNALNQLYDFIIQSRLAAAKNEQSSTESQKTVDSLFTVYNDIYRNPTSTSKKWYGATYLKWSSFSNNIPLENMLMLNIPILYIAGGKDNNQTIIDMDYAKLEFMRKRKFNLTYKVYPDCNHYFQQDTIINGKTIKTDRSDEVHEYALNWVNTN